MKSFILILFLFCNFLYSETHFGNLSYSAKPYATTSTLLKTTLLLPCLPSFHNEQYLMGTTQLAVDGFGLYYISSGLAAEFGNRNSSDAKAGIWIGSGLLLLNRLLSLPINIIHNYALSYDPILPFNADKESMKSKYAISLFGIKQYGEDIAISISRNMSNHHLRITLPFLDLIGDPGEPFQYSQFKSNYYVHSATNGLDRENLCLLEKYYSMLNYDYSFIKTEYDEYFIGIGFKAARRQYYRGIDRYSPSPSDSEMYILQTTFQKESSPVFSWQIYSRAGMNVYLLNNLVTYFSIGFLSKASDTYLAKNKTHFGEYPIIGIEGGLSLWIL